MLKTLGLLLIFGGGLFCWLTDTRRKRAEIRCVDGWIAALERIESEIRWKNEALPDILRGFDGGDSVARSMKAMLAQTGEDCPLQAAWARVTAPLQPQRLGEILAATSLGGDTESLTGNLLYSRNQLKEYAKALREKEKEYDRLHLAVTLSGAGMLVILLL
jgi:hypothetical protein